jgi:hypothetical protein
LTLSQASGVSVVFDPEYGRPFAFFRLLFYPLQAPRVLNRGKNYVKFVLTFGVLQQQLPACKTGRDRQNKKALVGAAWFALIWLTIT